MLPLLSCRPWDGTLARSRAPSLLVGDLSGKMYAWQRKAQTQTDLDHYALLGVTEGASEKEIRVAYRKLALRLHPDKATCVASRESNDQVREQAVGSGGGCLGRILWMMSLRCLSATREPAGLR